jgi:hypothetical protein
MLPVRWILAIPCQGAFNDEEETETVFWTVLQTVLY